MTLLKRANVGCGQTPTPNWYNIDNSPSLRLAKYPTVVTVLKIFKLLNKNQMNYISWLRSNQVIWADATKRIPLPEQSLEVLYTSHMLEHLDQKEARMFLGEAYRVLQNDGVIRISVPDFRLIIDKYIEHGDADQAVSDTYLAIDKPKSLLEKIKYVVAGGRHHHWMYDGNSLSRLLIEAGFRDPIVLKPGETTISEPSALNLHERGDVSLYVEAKR